MLYQTIRVEKTALFTAICDFQGADTTRDGMEFASMGRIG